MERAKALLREVFGFSSFRGLQASIVEHILAGGDAIVLMPTGGGKSLCYQLPAMVRPGTGIVISPLIALMQDQVSSLKQMGVRAEYLNSSLTPEQSRQVCRLLVRGELDLLYVSPERAVMSGFLEMLSNCPLSLIAIDEAHCVSQWGHDFRPEYLQLVELYQLFSQVPRVALTATADEPTRQDIVQRLDLAGARRFVSSFDRPNLRYIVEPKTSRSADVRLRLLDFIQSEHYGESGIVYCLTRRKVESVAGWLTREGINAYAYHAGLPTEERQRTQANFIREEGVVMVATVAFGMGIDKPNLRFVAHLDMPKSLEAYYQETGRAGRDGLPASCWMAYGVGDVVSLLQMMNNSNGDAQHRALERRKLQAMLGYCETTQCRRQVLLGYFGEQYKCPEGQTGCGNCDTCLNPVEAIDGTVLAQKALSAIARTGGRYGVSYLVDLLLGKSQPRMQQAGHDQLPTFGVGKDLSVDAWYSVFRQLAAAQIVSVDLDGYGSLRLTDKGCQVMRGELPISLRQERCRPRAAKGMAKSRRSTFGAALVTVGQRLSSKAASGTGAGADLAESASLFEALRTLRLQLARDNGVPPFVIFHDSTLQAMADSRPATLEQLSNIPGVGEAKLRKYGVQFLQAICGSR